ncbi:MAG: hypothetical protein UW55_C0010G0016 [Candidatus Giovannonibacteria bacterium GW2011_GWA2_44_26]|uniref:Uncharacterized protein n=1 Tax=Candidatus Giovannonibacteria bacterium GW2011_GWA2_44_26 TaxID=1618648 RepID=A0A0G1L252_9BACT|nr:MAG: hypothetical protein UW55_C0010G0016 [Candidatus Giovannonibacteria bacterium GW2011_GWA2_44_26]
MRTRPKSDEAVNPKSGPAIYINRFLRDLRRGLMSLPRNDKSIIYPFSRLSMGL